MGLELQVTGGALDGLRATFAQDRVLIGRDPHADIRFDADRDREISTRHAEIRRVEGRFLLRDLNSTNGTFLNGARIAGERALRDGDRIGCGQDGPVITVSLTGIDFATAGAMPVIDPAREPRLSPTPAAQRRPAVLAGLLGAVAVVVLGGWYAWTRASGAAPDGTVMLDRAGDSAAATLPGTVAGAGTLPETAARPAAAVPPGASALVAGGEMDYTAVAAANGAAIVLVMVEMPSGERSSGTAFSITPDGVLVTNRHVVRDPDGALPTRIAVQFSASDEILPARVVRVAEGSTDLALLQIDAEGPFPAVRGLAAPGTLPRVGSPVALIGYPLGLDTPMNRGVRGVIAEASLFRGSVSKNVQGVTMIQAFAGHGSSGSPVFDRRGAVVGVVYGGPPEGGGSIVYAVSGDELLAFVPASVGARVR